MSPAARAARTSVLDTRSAMHLVAVHARHFEALGLARTVQKGVVARALRAKTKIVPHQHVACAQAAQQHVVDEGLGAEAGQRMVEGQDHHLVEATHAQLRQLVAQRAHAAGASCGLPSTLAK